MSEVRSYRYHKLILNKREWNNCFIKYQLLDNISFLPTRVFGHFDGKSPYFYKPENKAELNYVVSKEPIRLPEIQ